MLRILGTCAAVALLLVLAYPFARDAYRRYEVGHKLDQVMTDRDRAAFQAWNGSPEAFGRSLYDRCVLTNGNGAPACEPYRTAIE